MKQPSPHSVPHLSQEEKRSAYHADMTETPVNRLIVRLAIPSILTMMITSIYNTADTYFVSQLGTATSAAVGVCFSLMTIIQTIGFTLGMGACNMLAKLLGQGNDDEANGIASTAFFVAGGIGLTATVFGLLFCSDLMLAIGATETNISHAKTYATYILLASPFMIMTCTMNCILRGEGKTFLGMLGMISGGVLNVLLDPILIFILDLGIAGAAIATAISQITSFSILLSMFIRRRSNIWLSISSVRGPRVLFRIVTLGSPTLCREGMGSLGIIVLNHAAGIYGDAAIAAMGIVGRISHLMNNFILGVNQGYQPVSGYNIGAGKYMRVYDATKFVAISTTLMKACIAAVIFAFAPQVVALFRDDPEVISFGTRALRLCCITAPLLCVYSTSNTAYQSSGKSLLALTLAFLKQGVFYIPLMLVLPRLIGALGIQIAMPLADFFSTAISIPFYLLFLRQMKKLSQEESGASPCSPL